VLRYWTNDYPANSKGVDVNEIVRIELPVITPSNNELLKMHWVAVWKLKEVYMWELVAVGAHDPKYKVKGKEKRIVRFMSFRPGILDTGNLAGGFKKLEDAMVDMELLFDDSPKYADITYFQKVDRENPHTEILILNGGNYGKEK